MFSREAVCAALFLATLGAGCGNPAPSLVQDPADDDDVVTDTPQSSTEPSTEPSPETCPVDALKTVPGTCGCDVADTDTDGDGVADCLDLCPADSAKVGPGTCGCAAPDIDSDGDGTADCVDECPLASGKLAPGACGCDHSDADSDGDGVPDCFDTCPGHDDNEDLDMGGTPDGCQVYSSCTQDADCSDGRSCTEDWCDQGRCLYGPVGSCPWPAESQATAENLTEIGGVFPDNEFYFDLSGAVWNPVTRMLWLVRNNGPSRLWALSEDPEGNLRIDTREGEPAVWYYFDDLEAVTQADFNEEATVYLLIEGPGMIEEYDMSNYGQKNFRMSWDLTNVSPVGTEGLTFVPDSFLAEQGFVDGDGDPYVSTQGMGGLMFVGHQQGGALYVYDLNRQTGDHIFVGRYDTNAHETAGLEFDRSTGNLYIWHDDNIDTMQVARLSSTNGVIDESMTFQGPATLPVVSTNFEGIALAPIDDCVDGYRTLYMMTDGGGPLALLAYNEWPCH